MAQKLAQRNVIKSVSAESIDSISEKVEAACGEVGFSVLGVIDIGEKLRSKGKDFPHQCRVFEVCDPGSALDVLSANPDLASLLPCRLALFAEAGTSEVTLSTVLPTSMVGLVVDPDDVDAMSEAEEIDERLKALTHALASGPNA